MRARANGKLAWGTALSSFAIIGHTFAWTSALSLPDILKILRNTQEKNHRFELHCTTCIIRKNHEE